jgi:hypothetical protein
MIIPSLGLIKFAEGIAALFEFPLDVSSVTLDEIGIARTEGGELFLRISDLKKGLHLAVSFEKVLKFVEENPELNKLQVALYKFSEIGDYLTAIGGITLAKEQIYEIKGMTHILRTGQH